MEESHCYLGRLKQPSLSICGLIRGLSRLYLLELFAYKTSLYGFKVLTLSTYQTGLQVGDNITRIDNITINLISPTQQAGVNCINTHNLRISLVLLKLGRYRLQLDLYKLTED